MIEARAPVPTDEELTGLPLAVIYEPRESSLEFDYHHGWVSRKSIMKSYPSIVGKALHASRGYVMPMRYHWHTPYGLHARLGGTKLPEGLNAVYSKTILGAAGVVPRLGLDLRDPEQHYITMMDNSQHAFLSQPCRTNTENALSTEKRRYKSDGKLGKFFAYYALMNMRSESELTSISAELKELELEAEQRGERTPAYRELGSLMYRETISTLIELLEPVESIYAQAAAEGMVPEEASTPSDTLVSFLPEHRFGDYCRHALEYWLPDELAQGAEVITLQTGVNRLESVAISN